MVRSGTNQELVVAYTKTSDKPELKLPWYGRWGNRLQVCITLLFLVFGLALLTTGIIMISVYKQIQRSEIEAFFNNIQFNGSLKVGYVINSLPVLCICVGGIIVLFVVVGCVARAKKSQVMLIVFSILIVWFLIVQILTTAIWVTVRDKFQNDVKSQMIEMFALYDGVTSTNDISKSWDYIFIDYECCGVDSISATENSDAFNVTQWWNNRDSELTLVPTSCCSHATEDTYKSYTDTACQNVLLAHHKKGCFDVVVDWLEYFWTPAIVFSAMLIAIEVVVICLSCVLCCAVRKAREIK